MATLDLLVKVAVQNAGKLDSLSGKLRGAGTALTIGVTGPLVAAGAAITSMAIEAEEAQAKLKSLFDETEASAWTSIEALQEHQQALMDATTFDDEDIAAAQTALLGFGTIVGEQFSDATDAAADLAAFLGVDVEDAARKLGKALSDPEAGLGRLKMAIGPLTDEQERLIDQFVEAGDTASAQQVILDAVSDKIGTTAEDLAATSGGQMAQAMNQLAEAGEAMGTFLLPVISGVAGFLKDMAAAFLELDPQIQQFILIAAGVAAVLGPVLLILSLMLPAIGAIGVALGLLISPIGIVVAAVAAFAIWIATHWDRVKEQTGMLVDAIKGFFLAIGTAFSNLGRAISNVWDNIVDVFRGAISAIASIGGRIWDPLAEGFTAAIDVIRGIWNAFARFWNSIQISVPSVDIPLVGKVGGFNVGLPDLPHLATGGIVSAPTLAIIGERGPEAVVPLSKGFGTTETHIHLTYAGEPPEEPRDLVALLLQVAPFVDGRLRVTD